MCAESVLNALKRKHHDLIVTALENGADEEEHTRLLAVKEAEVLAGMADAEERLNIVFDKEEPTKQGPVRVTEVL